MLEDRIVEESDLENLLYMKAIIKEPMRLYLAAPLSIPHESTEDCIINGYTIPKGTRMLVNVLKIQHDPHIWTDPFEFQPERFLTSEKEIDVKGQHFELIPFGSGRRMCPVISFYVAPKRERQRDTGTIQERETEKKIKIREGIDTTIKIY
ncbi:cytochrome P450 CYP82D47-like protein [Tanacetum coccineum]